MKLMKLASLILLLFVSVASLAAQNTLPDPHNDNCWSSLSALRACQLQAETQAQEHAQNCTSYPEYQCFDYYQPPQKTSAKSTSKANAKSTVPITATSPIVAPDTNVQTGAAN